MLTADGASRIWKLFQMDSTPNSFDNFKYRVFLQGAMMGWVDASSGMGFIESIFTSSIKPDATVLSILKDLLQEGFKQYYKNKIKNDPE